MARRKKLTDTQIASLPELRKKLGNLDLVAEELGVSQATISRYMPPPEDGKTVLTDSQEERDARIVRLYIELGTVTQVQRITGHAYLTVSHALQMAGIRCRIGEEEVAAMRAAFTAGKKVPQLAKEFGISPSTVHRFLKSGGAFPATPVDIIKAMASVLEDGEVIRGTDQFPSRHHGTWKQAVKQALEITSKRAKPTKSRKYKPQP